MPTHDENIQTVQDLIQDVTVAMLNTVDDAGRVHSRPMVAQNAEFDGTLWFFTGTATEQVSELLQHRQVGVSFANPEKHRYVSMSGEAQLVNDRPTMEKFWNPVYATWFPRGLDDPTIALLRVDVDTVEYWDGAAGLVKKVIELVKGMVSDRPPSPGEHDAFKLE